MRARGIRRDLRTTARQTESRPGGGADPLRLHRRDRKRGHQARLDQFRAMPGEREPPPCLVNSRAVMAWPMTTHRWFAFDARGQAGPGVEGLSAAQLPDDTDPHLHDQHLTRIHRHAPAKLSIAESADSTKVRMGSNRAQRVSFFYRASWNSDLSHHKSLIVNSPTLLARLLRKFW